MRRTPLRLANILGSILLILGAVLAYYLFHLGDFTHSYFLIPFGVLAATLFIFKSQINYWGITKQKIALPIEISQLLQSRMPFISDLSGDDRLELEEQIAHYYHALEFTGQGLENIPTDIKYLIAAQPFILKWRKKEDLYNYDRIVLYPHPFLSPQFEDNIHICEHHKEDGVLVFSLDQLLGGFQNPKDYMNTVLLEYVTIFCELLDDPIDDQSSLWTRLTEFIGVDKERILQYYGRPMADVRPLILTYYIESNKEIGAKFPELKALFQYVK